MYNQDSGPTLLGILLYVAATVFYVYCYWRIFEKASKPGWASIIPFYSAIVRLGIIGRPWWWFLLMFVPLVDIVIGIIVIFEMGNVFGKGTGFGFGLFFLSFIFIPILAFDGSTYQGALMHA